MKRALLFTAILFGLVAVQCGGGNESRRDATTVGEKGWVFEGWACAPPASSKGISPAEYCKGKKEKDMDYLYMKFSAVASERAIKSGRMAAMMSTCRKAAKDQVSADGLAKIIGEYLETASGVADGQSTGSAIVAQSRGKIRGVGLYDCCAMDPRTAECMAPGKENWEQCLCVGYMRYPGGRDAFEAMAEEVQAGGF